MAVADLLAQLRKVKPAGPGKWLACCPAHGDRHPSLAIRELDDGRVLLHCFTGCEPAAVLHAVGLDFVDLLPERAIAHHIPRERHPFTASDALRALASESGVIAIAIAELAEGRQFSPADADRVDLASGRLQTALEYVYGNP